MFFIIKCFELFYIQKYAGIIIALCYENVPGKVR